ncbi:PorP/SprF family type IX secretion system membrane protein [Tamlana flava]|uniref:PorP/SprF family type IX secretion system membrane protein n=1 Tax=Tamlana flava TaxID=3158572 RepID=UPI00351BA853
MKTIIKNTCVLLVLLLTNTLFAQQDPSYTIYQYNMNVINPAFAGINDYNEININFRSQWVNLKGSPETRSFSLGIPMNDRVGWGLSVVNDEIFVLNETDVYIDFSYRIPVGQNSNLYMGLKGGGSFVDIDLNRLGIKNDPVFMENVNNFNPNVGVGFLLKSQKYYINISAPALLKSKRYEKDGVVVTNATNRLHAYLGGGYTVALNQNINLIPSFMCRFVNGAPVSLDLTSTVDIYEKVEFGASYRLDESLSILGLFELADWFMFGYAYENTLTDVKDYSRGSHEVLIRFKIH